MKQSLILVVDDDPAIRTLLRNVFEGGGYRVAEASDAGSAVDAVETKHPDLVTLDLQLGSEDGLDVARSIRKSSQVPVIMVTGRDDVVDRVVGLEIGADDYITKPFHVREVLARVRTVLRRATQTSESAELVEMNRVETPNSPVFTFDGLTVVPDRMELFDREGSLCDLTSGDFRLLEAFLKNAKRVLSRNRLMDLTGGTEWSPLDRTIDNQVARLRKKVERDPREPRLIKTVRGVGYSLACDVTRTHLDPSCNSA